MHMMTACLDRELGDTWPLHCVFMDGSNEERSRMLSLQSEATLCLAVLSTSTHWGLLCICRGKPQAILLDGLRDPTLHDAALAFLEHLHQQQNWSGPYSLEYGKLSQDDDWSCGHLGVLSAQAVIKGRGSWPPDLGDHASSSAVKNLCAQFTAKPVKREATAKPVKREATTQDPGSSNPPTHPLVQGQQQSEAGTYWHVGLKLRGLIQARLRGRILTAVRHRSPVISQGARNQRPSPAVRSPKQCTSLTTTTRHQFPSLLSGGR